MRHSSTGPSRLGLGLGLLAAAALATSCGAVVNGRAGAAPTSAAHLGAPSAGSGGQAPLSAPKTSPTQDGQYFTDLAQADPALASYVQARGDVALRALLTDGSAFCAFLERGGGVDNAMASVVLGAHSVERQTHLPSTVTTFNAIDAVALLDLCPGDEKLLPASDRSRVRKLGTALSARSS